MNESLSWHDLLEKVELAACMALWREVGRHMTRITDLERVRTAKNQCRGCAVQLRLSQTHDRHDGLGKERV